MFDAAPDRYTFEVALRGVAAAMADDHAAPMRLTHPVADIASPAPVHPARSRAHLRLVEPA